MNLVFIDLRGQKEAWSSSKINLIAIRRQIVVLVHIVSVIYKFKWKDTAISP